MISFVSQFSSKNTNTIMAALAAIKRLRAELSKISWLQPHWQIAAQKLTTRASSLATISQSCAGTWLKPSDTYLRHFGARANQTACQQRTSHDWSWGCLHSSNPRPHNGVKLRPLFFFRYTPRLTSFRLKSSRISSMDGKAGKYTKKQDKM